MSTIDPDVLAETQKLSDSLSAYNAAKATNDQAAAALEQAAQRLMSDLSDTKSLLDAKVAAVLPPPVTPVTPATPAPTTLAATPSVAAAKPAA